ncbi:MAG: PepSY domain-containing protein [Mycobacteriales bacterium]
MAALGGVAVATGTVPIGDDLDRPGSITVDERALPDNDAAERDALSALADVSKAEATAAAVKAVGGGEAVRAELEDEDGYVWEVVVRAGDGTGREVTVDAGDASILRSERADDDGDDRDDRSSLRAPGTVVVDERKLPENDAAELDALTAPAKIDQVAAGAAAVQSVGGGEAVRVELEEEGGFVVWDVLVRGGDGSWREVTVDAGDARILGTDLDGDDEDD